NPHGISSASPVGTPIRDRGSRRSGPSAADTRSIPAASADMYRGVTAPGRSLRKRTRITGEMESARRPGTPEKDASSRGRGAEVVDHVRCLAERLAAREADLAGGAVDA